MRGSIEQMSIPELEEVINRRKASLDLLRDCRRGLEAQLNMVDQAIVRTRNGDRTRSGHSS